MQPICQTPYDLNRELLFHYSSHDLNNKPFNEQTVLDHLNTELVHYSNAHCTVIWNASRSFKQANKHPKINKKIAKMQNQIKKNASVDDALRNKRMSIGVVFLLST